MDTSSFLDFDLQINKIGKKYQAQVLESPAGQASSVFSLPISTLELENFYLRIGRPRQGVRRVDSPEMETVKKVGGRLFDAVFSEDILALLSSSLAIARSQGKGLRIRLRQTSPEAADLPWEYLYDSRQNRFLALAVQTPIIRYLEVPQAGQALTVDLPLKVLVMVSNPSDYPELDVESEYARLSNALQPLVQKGMVNLERLDHASLDALQRQLRTGKQHIFQFIGHGGFDPSSQEGVLILEDENHLGKRISGQELGWLLHNYPSLRLVVLNACEGARSSRQDPFAGVAQSLVQQGIPAVIAMQFEITDQAALIFSQNFYSALSEGNPVDTALSEARMSIFTSGNDIEWGTPVLFTRSSDGHLFDIPVSYPLPHPVEPLSASRVPERLSAAPPPSIESPTSTATPKSSSRRVPLWTWILAGLLILAIIGGGIYLSNSFSRSGQDEHVITQSVPVKTDVAVLLNPTEGAQPTVSGGATVLGVPITTPSPQSTEASTQTTELAEELIVTETPAVESGLPASITDEHGVPMVIVSAGTFPYGSNMGEPDEQPAQTIFLDDFYIDQYEVTNARYAECVAAGTCSPPEEWGSNTHADYYNNPSFTDYPVIFINWESAQTYCEWRGGRLPTEAEWEKAGRGTDGRTYPWGEGASCSLANLYPCVEDVTQVGSYPAAASPYGALDMSGNVWEWTADWYSADYYTTLGPETSNPTGPESGSERVIRGGSWADARYQLRLTERFQFNPLGSDNALGFRCVRTP